MSYSFTVDHSGTYEVEIQEFGKVVQRTLIGWFADENGVSPVALTSLGHPQVCDGNYRLRRVNPPK